MTRTLFVGTNNELKDKLETSSDGGATWTAVDLTAATDVVLQIYDDPDSPVIEISGTENFTLDASGNATWQPGATDIVAADAGKHDVRWIVKTAAEPQGVVFEAEPVEIKD